MRHSPQIFAKITKEDIDFSTLDREHVSEEAQEFLKLLLTKDPKERPTAAEALRHSWLQEDEGAAEGALPALKGTLIQRLQRFAVMGPFKKAALPMVAEELSRNDDTWRDVLRNCSELHDIYHGIAGGTHGPVDMAEVKVGATQVLLLNGCPPAVAATCSAQTLNRGCPCCSRHISARKATM